MAQPIKKKIQEEHSDLIKEEQTLTLLVDGNSLLFSSFACNYMNPDGIHYGAIFEFLLQLRMQLTQRQFNRIFISFDNEYSGVLRYQIYNLYKANRDKNYADYGVSEYMKEYNAKLKSMQDTIFGRNKTKKSEDGEIVQEKVKSSSEEFIDANFDRERDILCEIFNDLFIRWNMDEVVEGDDLIAYYCLHKKKNEKILIISADMDLCQLLSDDIMIYNQKMKKYISNKNFSQYFGYNYENILLRKIFCGDVSDNIGNIRLLSESAFEEMMPEIKTRKVEIEEVKNRAKQLIEERVKNKKKPLQVHENIINGVSNKKYDGDFYEINEKIVNLKKPILTKECEEEMDALIESSLDPEGRNFKNIIKIIYDQQMTEIMSDTKCISFFAPFKRIEEKEREYFEKNK